LGKHLNTLSFTITYTQDNATTQASAHSGAGWAARLPRMSISQRRPLSKGKTGPIGPISAPQDGRPLNSETTTVGGPISLSAIGRQDVQVDTAPEATRRREEMLQAMEGDEIKEKEERPREGKGTGEETLEEKINRGHEAWREGDNIIIEDEHGEVIHTVRSPVDGDKITIVDKLNKAEEKVGELKDGEGITGRLKRMWSGRKYDTPPPGDRRRSVDLEKGGIPEEAESSTTAVARSSNETGSSNNSPSKPRSGSLTPGFVVDEDNRRTDHVNDRTQRRAREEREEETEVERRRREAVLGITEDSDEDEVPHPNIRSKGKQPASELAVIDDDDDDDEEEGEEDSPSQSQAGSAGAESSTGSGTQLLVPPPPARTRGIRFGDINVGTESFSLEDGPPGSGGGARHHRTGSGASGDWRSRRRSDR